MSSSPLRLLFCLFVLIAAFAAIQAPFSPARAQTNEATTVQLSQQQLDQIVKSVTGAVLEQLKTGQQAGPEGGTTATPAPPQPKRSAGLEEGLASLMQEQEYVFIENFERTFRAFPDLFAEAGSIFARLDARPQGYGQLAFLGILTAIFAVAGALALAGCAVGRLLLPGVAPKGGSATVSETLRRAVATLAGYGLFWLVTAVAARKLFGGEDMQATVGHWILQAVAQFGFSVALLLIWFRPREPAYRIVPLEGEDAWTAMRVFLGVLGIASLRSWILIPLADNQPEAVIAAGMLINNLLFFSIFFLTAVPAKDAIRRWIENTAMRDSLSWSRRWLATHWLTVAGTGVVLLSAIHAVGAVAGHNGVVAGLSGSVRGVVTMILFCALVEFVGRRSQRADQLAKRTIPKLPGLVSQMLRVFIVLGAAIYFIKLWFVDALQVMAADDWSNLADYAFEPLAALFGGYLAISYVNYLSARYIALHPVSMATVSDDGEIVTRADESSRLRTLIPILRVTAIIIIIVMIGLLLLSHLGFNITPLLAGASVIGLAISFGSQALVKDIVSGVLFLAEDSFRIGEYIQCGSSSGTVEGFTLRSVRLRHEDGQIFTVPFGQLGEITNFSRDWSTVNFNMSLDRDVDLDDVRNVTARVAAELKSEFRDRLLDPLKVKGVKDVTDYAIIVQFKFTALPRDPSEIERVARIRLLKAFKEEGIVLTRSRRSSSELSTAG